MEFYLHDGHVQHGPYSAEDLRKHPAFKPDTLIWYEGISNWTPAREIDSLKDIFKSSPPPPPVPQVPVKATVEPESVAESAGRNFGKKISYLRPLIILIVVIVVGVIAYDWYNKDQVARVAEDRRNHVRDNIRSYVTVGNSAYQTSGLGGIYGLSIEVANQTDYLLDNVQVLIRYVKANGETWKEETIDFALVPPNKTMTIRAPDSDRGTSIDYKIVSIKSSVLGLY